MAARRTITCAVCRRRRKAESMCPGTNHCADRASCFAAAGKRRTPTSAQREALRLNGRGWMKRVTSWASIGDER